jgi:hypothetical protein
VSNIENESRAQFEAWHREQVTRLRDHGELGGAKKWEDLKWICEAAWQASRQALVIELPQSRGDTGERANGDQSLLSALMANQLAIDECRSAIESQGVKCK